MSENKPQIESPSAPEHRRTSYDLGVQLAKLRHHVIRKGLQIVVGVGGDHAMASGVAP